MVMDIMKFFFLYVLVLFAFSSGLNQLLWYYADLEKKRCVDNIQSTNPVINGTADPNACIVWRRFANLFETTQTLFWAVFGLVDLDSFELDGIKIFTRFWGMLMFGTYSVINIVVLLNLLIAMMNHSYQLISERADIEWKFARSRLWISYFEEGGTCPPPFNVIPTPKSFWYIFQWIKRKFCGHSRSVKKEHMRTIRAKQANQRDFIYQTIMRNLVRRYVTVEQRKAESQGVTEDDVNEIKQDISAFRCELVEILKNSGMNTSTASGQGSGAGGKKNRQKERRLMKGFNIAPPQQSTQLPPVAEFISGLTHQNSDSNNYELFGSPLANVYGPGITPKKTHHNPIQQFSSSQSSFGDSQPSMSAKLGKLAPKFHTKRIGGSHKRRWGTLIEAAKSGSVSRFIGRSRSEDSVCNAPPNVGNRMDSASHSNSPASDEAVTESATDSNPSLDRPDVETPREMGKEPTTHHFHFSALAALKRRRKKFSNSRNASPVLEPPIEHDGVSKSSKKLLKRASSVPTRPTINESTESIPQNGQDVPACGDAVSATLTTSTTDESVAGHLVIPICPTEPLLAGAMSNVMKMDANGHQQMPNLPNVIPVRGHLHQQGWL